jgi:hypothetical protein
MSDTMRAQLDALSEKVRAIRQECGEHTAEYPGEYGRACFDEGFQMAMATVFSWLPGDTYSDRYPIEPVAYRVRKEIGLYLLAQDDWLMRSEDLPWAEQP